MRLIYRSEKGGKPLNMGMNVAKRLARSADKRDQAAVLRELGPGYPRQHHNHQRLVKQRHAYYGDVYEQTVRQAGAGVAPLAASPSPDNQDAGAADGAVSEPEDRSDH